MIFLSPPCDIIDTNLVTHSSWYRFITQLGYEGDTLKIASPALINNNDTFKIKQIKRTLIKVKQFRYNTFKSYYNFFFLKPFYVLKIYIKAIITSDIVLFRIPNPGFTIVSIISLLFKKPVIVFISGNIIDQSDTYKNAKGFFKLFLNLVMLTRKSIHKFIFIYAKHIFPVSKDISNLYNIKDKSNTTILRTPVISLHNITDEYLLNEYNPKKILRVIRVCLLQESKGLENLIHVVNNLKKKYEIKVDIYGEAKNIDYKSKIIMLIDKLKLSQNIELKGWVSNDQLKKLYNNYDLHLVSSVSEGMPRVCLEASAYGLPQILTPVGGVEDYYRHMHDAYICKNYSINAIENGIIWFIENPKKAKSMAINSLKNIKTDTIEETTSTINKILDKCL